VNSLKGIELADYFIGVSGQTKGIADGYYDEVVNAVCRRASGVPADADLVIFNNGTNMNPPLTENDFDARIWIYAEVFKEAEDIRDSLISALGGFNPEVLKGLASFGLMKIEFTPYALDAFSEELRSTYREELSRALSGRTAFSLGTLAKNGSVSRGRISDVPVKSAAGSN
jgi:hypothetical protein